MLQQGSCVCTSLDDLLADDGADDSDLASWRTALTNQLVELVLLPAAARSGNPTRPDLAGASVLVATLDSALRAQLSPTASIEVAWQQIVAQTENLEMLHAAMTMLEEAAEQRRARS